MPGAVLSHKCWPRLLKFMFLCEHFAILLDNVSPFTMTVTRWGLHQGAWFSEAHASQYWWDYRWNWHKINWFTNWITITLSFLYCIWTDKFTKCSASFMVLRRWQPKTNHGLKPAELMIACVWPIGCRLSPLENHWLRIHEQKQMRSSERTNLMLGTSERSDFCNSLKRMVPSRLHE